MRGIFNLDEKKEIKFIKARIVIKEIPCFVCGRSVLIFISVMTIKFANFCYYKCCISLLLLLNYDYFEVMLIWKSFFCLQLSD